MPTKKPWYEGERYQQARAQREADHQKAEEAAANEAEANRRSNAEARAKYLAGLEAQRLERIKQDDARFDLAVAGEKVSRRRQWLIDHPNEDAQDFEKKAWPLIRVELIEADKKETGEQMYQQLIASGNYAGLI